MCIYIYTFIYISIYLFKIMHAITCAPIVIHIGGSSLDNSNLACETSFGLFTWFGRFFFPPFFDFSIRLAIPFFGDLHCWLPNLIVFFFGVPAQKDPRISQKPCQVWKELSRWYSAQLFCKGSMGYLLAWRHAHCDDVWIYHQLHRRFGSLVGADFPTEFSRFAAFFGNSEFPRWWTF